jgi:hypothetical protein
MSPEGITPDTELPEDVLPVPGKVPRMAAPELSRDAAQMAEDGDDFPHSYNGEYCL